MRLTLAGAGGGARRRGRQPRPADPVASVYGGSIFRTRSGWRPGSTRTARVPDAMLRLGFGFTEIGTVTPRPQPGNPRPRVFRLAADAALINRLGFNSGGLDGLVARLGKRPRPGHRRDQSRQEPRQHRRGRGLCRGGAAHGGAGRLSGHQHLVAEHAGAAGFAGARRRSTRWSRRCWRRGRRAGRRRRCCVKIAPDLGPEEAADIAEIAATRGIDGIVIGNTTIARPASLRSREAAEGGGLSGRPLFARSTELLGEMYRLTGGRSRSSGSAGSRAQTTPTPRSAPGRRWCSFIRAGLWRAGRWSADQAGARRTVEARWVRVGLGGGRRRLWPMTRRPHPSRFTSHARG